MVTRTKCNLISTGYFSQRKEKTHNDSLSLTFSFIDTPVKRVGLMAILKKIGPSRWHIGGGHFVYLYVRFEGRPHIEHHHDADHF